MHMFSIKNITMKHTCLIIILSWVTLPLLAQTEETEQQKQMARQMARYMDAAWEAKPKPGLANLRLLIRKDGEPYAGVVSIHGALDLQLKGPMQYTVAFNPNNNGRYVLEDIEPGNYIIMLKGRNEFDGFDWIKQDFNLVKGEKPVIEVNID